MNLESVEFVGAFVVLREVLIIVPVSVGKPIVILCWCLTIVVVILRTSI